MSILILAFVFLMGSLIGSFLNVCIYRLPRKEEIVVTPSHCALCNHPLQAMDLIPVLSYLFLKGKCRYCHEKISKQYMLVELATGGLFTIIFYKWGLSFESFYYCIFAAIMMVLTVIDLKHMLLPTPIILFGVGVGLVGRIIKAVLEADIQPILEGVIGGILGYLILFVLFYLAIWMLKKEGLGFGDVRYLGMIGIFTSWKMVLITLFMAAILGSVYAIGVYCIKKVSEPFPLGPFLSIGALLSIFYGNQLIEWYLNVSGLRG